MGDVVNLRRARKAKVRTDAQTQAAANRAAFGRTKAEKQADAAEAERREQALDGAKREG
ncbi:DUF4169 family protein [Sphingomonas lenta]|uniref:DUF4169 domain-containing protein n=1 Tax=Sphingomonas lenta TaxID=1141887 RepID=A0A2A2SF63_9SPHN|nr:DUF4169 family protein [Sphingomonas lenta]PAX07832.1 DUF4169 domain-containing protein [Sphingomonas lenta]